MVVVVVGEEVVEVEVEEEGDKMIESVFFGISIVLL